MLKIKPERLVYVMKHRPIRFEQAGTIAEKPERITRKALAEAIGLESERPIQTARTSGEISEKNLAAICSLLDVSKNYFLGINDIKLNSFESYLESSANIVVRTDKPNDAKEAIEWFKGYKHAYLLMFHSAINTDRIDNSGIYIPFSFVDFDYLDGFKSFNFKQFIYEYMQSDDYSRIHNDGLPLDEIETYQKKTGKPFFKNTYSEIAPFIDGVNGLADRLNKVISDEIDKYAAEVTAGKYALVSTKDYFDSLVKWGNKLKQEAAANSKTAASPSDRTQSPPDRTQDEPEKPDPVKPIDKDKPTK